MDITIKLLTDISRSQEIIDHCNTIYGETRKDFMGFKPDGTQYVYNDSFSNKNQRNAHIAAKDNETNYGTTKNFWRDVTGYINSYESAIVIRREYSVLSDVIAYILSYAAKTYRPYYSISSTCTGKRIIQLPFNSNIDTISPILPLRKIERPKMY